MTISSSQKKLIGSFLLITPLFGLAVICVHYLLKMAGWAPLNMLIYIPFILAGATAIYVMHLKDKVKAVKFKGAGTSSVPIMYFIAMLIVPMPFLQGISIITDQVVEIATIEQWSSAENESFVHIASMQPKPEALIDTVTFNTVTDDNDLVKTNYQYVAIIPLESKNKSAWLVFKNFEILDENLPIATIKKKQKNYWQEKRSNMTDYNYDSIRYVTKIEDDRVIELLKWKNISTENAILLSPSSQSTADYRMSLIWISSIALLIASCFFVFAVVFGHHEHIEHE